MIEYENLRKVNEPFFKEFEKSFRKTMESGWFILGENVSRFEQDFSEYIGAKYCVGVASGLDALILSLRAFDFERGSEVIVPANTYIATIFSILHCGLKPVLVEPDIKTYNIDPTKIEEKITKKTAAIIAVHLYGKPCDMGSIMEIIKRHNLVLIEDCAQSHGAMYKNKKTGSFGLTGAFSFYPTKILGALGDAGAVVTDSIDIYEKIKKLRNYGSGEKYYNSLIGYNSRLDEIQAGILSVKLKNLDNMIAHKRYLARIYLEGLKDDYIKPVLHDDYFDVYHIFNVRHPERDKLKRYLAENGVVTDIHYPMPPHRQKALNGILDSDYFPISEEIHNSTLSLPISSFHTSEEIKKVIEIMNKF
jgi:dTDP-4-amino-4,6-dideoxygalactose transaminase